MHTVQQRTIEARKECSFVRCSCTDPADFQEAAEIEDEMRGKEEESLPTRNLPKPGIHRSFSIVYLSFDIHSALPESQPDRLPSINDYHTMIDDYHRLAPGDEVRTSKEDAYAFCLFVLPLRAD